MRGSLYWSLLAVTILHASLDILVIILVYLLNNLISILH